MIKKEYSGKEVRYLLKQNSVNLSWLAEQLGISPQSLQERLKAQSFKRGNLLEIANVLGKDIFGLQSEDGASLMKQPILDIRVCAGNGIGLEGNENHVEEYVSIPSLQGCTGISVYGYSMEPLYRSGDVVFVRPIAQTNDIDYGCAYLVITRCDRLLKNVYPSKQSDEYLRLCCSNEETNRQGERLYPDREIHKTDILYLYKVVGMLRRSQM